MEASVFVDAQSRCVLALSEDNGLVRYVLNDGDQIRVARIPHSEFHRVYRELEFYPPGKAAQKILDLSEYFPLTSEARSALTQVTQEFPMGATKTVRAPQPAEDPKKDKTGKKGAKPEAAPAPEPKGKKAAAPAPAPEPKGKKAETKAEKPAKEAKVVDTEDKTPIKVLNKENPHREGSHRAEAFAAVLTCKTVGAYNATGNKTKYLKDWADSGHISIG